MKRSLCLSFVLAIALWAAPASAHMFWVNLTESFAHPPGHVTTMFGWGHVLPVGDLLAGENGVIRIKSYELIGPDGGRTDLGLPDPTVHKPAPGAAGTLVQTGDLGLRKISLTPDSKPGTYQVAAVSEPMYFTKYRDAKGKMRMAPKPMDAIMGGVGDKGEVLSSFRYQSFTKAFFAVEKWTEPEPLGHGLEIVPLSDLSNLHEGDLARFRVTFNGKPVTVTPENIRSMTCVSNTFGGPDGFTLQAYVQHGEAQFRMPAAGQWVANIYYQQKVADDAGLAKFKDKCTVVYTGGSVGFTVKP